MASKSLPPGVRKHTSRSGYEYRFTHVDPITGHSSRKSLYRSSLQELRKAIIDVHSRQDARAPVFDSRISVGSWADYWIENQLPFLGLKPATQALYRCLIKAHIKGSKLSATPLRSVRPSLVTSFLGEKEQAGLGGSSRRNLFAVLSHLFNSAEVDGLIAKSPLGKGVNRPKRTRAETRFLDEAELAALFADLRNSRHFEIFKLILLTGMRRGEALGLTWDCVDFKNGRINVAHTLGSDSVLYAPKSERSRRFLDMTADARSVLELQRLRQSQEEMVAGSKWKGNQFNLVFTSPHGTAINGRNVLRTIQSAAERLALNEGHSEKIGVHTLRHTVASRLLQSSIPFYVVSRILGHESITTTVDIYGHLGDSDRKSALETLTLPVG